MRVILMSTPEFGRPTLRALLEGGYEVVGLVCQPDKPAGRGLPLRPPPMKLAALDEGIPVFQPAGFREPGAVDRLAETRPDLILVAAYGLFIPQTVTGLAHLGALNLHPSLLPRWRGACPVPAAIRAGDAETGVTVHFVVDEMDAGAILAQASMPLAPDDRAPGVMSRLADLGASLLVTTLPGWLSGAILPQTQDHGRALWCDRLTRDDGRLDWELPAAVLARRVRAYDPWPGTFTSYAGSILHILDASPWEDWQGAAEPGRVFRGPGGIAVAAGRGALVLHTVQAAGRRALPVEQFARGQRGFVDALLGAE